MHRLRNFAKIKYETNVVVFSTQTREYLSWTQNLALFREAAKKALFSGPALRKIIFLSSKKNFPKQYGY